VSDKSDNNNNRRRRVVIVTGSGRGIGKAIAIEFAKAGYYVMMNDFEQEEELKRTAEEISKLVAEDKEKNNNRVAYVVGDISQEQISISLIEETIKRFGRIDILINNAEIAEKPTMKKTTTPTTNEITTATTTATTSNATNSFNEQISPYFTLEEYEIADLYLKGIYLCIREAVKRMVMGVADKKEKNENDNKNNNNKRKKSNYSIINISSPYQSIPKPEADEYTFSMSGVDPFTSSRAGVKSLTKTVALQLAEKGIRVNAIAPGLIATDIINKELLEKEEKRKEKEKEIPFHRIGEPEEIAKIALFLASDDASYITGNMIYVDGGLSLSRSNYFLESKLEQD
jgi:glucose 1-dehydrogenase